MKNIHVQCHTTLDKVLYMLNIIIIIAQIMFALYLYYVSAHNTREIRYLQKQINIFWHKQK